MSARKRFALLAAGIALGAGLVVLPAMAVPLPEPVAPVEDGAVVADPQPTALPVPVEAVKPDVPLLPIAPVEPVSGDSGYVPSTGDCGPDGYRIEPGTCEWYVGGEIGDAVDCDFECVVDSTPPFEEDEPGWDCRYDGNGLCGVTLHGTVYVLDFHTGRFYER